MKVFGIFRIFLICLGCVVNVFCMDTSQRGLIRFYLCDKHEDGCFFENWASEGDHVISLDLDSAEDVISETRFKTEKSSWGNVLVWLKNKLKSRKLTNEAKGKLGMEDLKSVSLDKIKICYIWGVVEGMANGEIKGISQRLVPEEFSSEEISPEKYNDVVRAIENGFERLKKKPLVISTIIDVYCYIETSGEEGPAPKGVKNGVSKKCCCC